jgi:hypothetical protein
LVLVVVLVVVNPALFSTHEQGGLCGGVTGVMVVLLV